MARATVMSSSETSRRASEKLSSEVTFSS
jgi:hypothetical protein